MQHTYLRFKTDKIGLNLLLPRFDIIIIKVVSLKDKIFLRINKFCGTLFLCSSELL
eukprot:jgi/Pico_ML_1/52474/g3175.t1